MKKTLSVPYPRHEIASVIVGFMTFLACYLLVAISAGGAVALQSDFADNDVSVWNAVGPVDADGVDQHLRVTFRSQSWPALESCVVGAPVAAGVYPTNITFRIRANNTAPSALRIVLHSQGSGYSWFSPLTAPTRTGEWYVYRVAIGPGYSVWANALGPFFSPLQFYFDLYNVDTVGIYLRRHGSTMEQAYDIDDIAVTGTPFPINSDVSGVINNGEPNAPGPICVAAIAPWNNPPITQIIQRVSANTFSATNLPVPAIWEFVAFIDTNTNGTQDAFEPYGRWTPPTDTDLFLAHRTDVEIVIGAMRDTFGVPRWWLEQHFARFDTPPVSTAEAPAPHHALADPDGDGLDNRQEYLAGSDPLRRRSAFHARPQAPTAPRTPGIFSMTWPSVPGRVYHVWRRETAAREFIQIATLPATSPENYFEDVSGLNALYKVSVEEI